MSDDGPGDTTPVTAIVLMLSGPDGVRLDKLKSFSYDPDVPNAVPNVGLSPLAIKTWLWSRIGRHRPFSTIILYLFPVLTACLRLPQGARERRQNFARMLRHLWVKYW
jgi:hypothetical protein